MAANIKTHFEAQANENQASLNAVLAKLDNIKTLVKEKIKDQQKWKGAIGKAECKVKK